MPTGLAVLVVVGALLLSSAGGWPVVWGVLRLASRSSDAGRTGRAPVGGERSADEGRGDADGPTGAAGPARGAGSDRRAEDASGLPGGAGRGEASASAGGAEAARVAGSADVAGPAGSAGSTGAARSTKVAGSAGATRSTEVAGSTGAAGSAEVAGEDERRGAFVESDGPDGARARAVLRGGTWIGVLERLAVTGCVLAGQPSGVAVVVAVKGLGRYPELRENPGASERFVIGTLASLVWSAGLGYVGTLLLAL